MSKPKPSNPNQHSEIVYPDGALTFGDKSTVDEYWGRPDKTTKESDAFRRQTGKTIEIDGRKMTRLETVDAYLDAIKAPAPETQAQPETSPTPDFSSAKPLTDDEIEKITFNNDPKTLAVDERLGATLYNKYPNIKEAVDVLFEQAQTSITYERRKDAGRDDARKKLLTLLREDFSPYNAELVGAQYMIDTWRAKKIHGTKPSDKSKKIDEEVTAIIKNAHNNKTNLNPQDIYQRVGKLLYPEKFLSDRQAKPQKAETPKATLDIRTRSNGKIDFCAVNNQR